MTKREPDPQRMVQAYFYSAATLNYLRAMNSGGVADLHHPDSWILDHIQDDAIRKEYEKIIDQITDGLDFFRVINADRTGSLKSVELYTSHEGLLMGYEEALTRKRGKRKTGVAGVVTSTIESPLYVPTRAYSFPWLSTYPPMFASG